MGICSVEALSAIPKDPVRYDLDRAAELLRDSGHRLENIGVMITIQLRGREVTIFKNGRISIYPAESKEQAEGIAARIYDTIEAARECE